jgi:hypothetical protein
MRVWLSNTEFHQPLSFVSWMILSAISATNDKSELYFSFFLCFSTNLPSFSWQNALSLAELIPVDLRISSH